MIHILSTLSAGTEQNPLVAASGDSSSGSFMALFAQAITQGVAGDKAGNPLLATLLGHKGQKVDISVEGLAVEAKQPGQPLVSEAGDATADIDASLMSMLGLPGAGSATSVATAAEIESKSVTVAKAKAVGVAAGVVPDVVTATVPGVVAEVVAAARNMAGVVLEAQAVPVAADAGKPAQTAVPGAVTAPAAALVAITIDQGPSGKKLPNPRAVIAGQAKPGLIGARLDVSKIEIAKPEPSSSDLLPDDPRLATLSVLPVSKDAAASIATSDAVTMPVSGQEAALLAVRGHAAGQSGKLVLGMQSGFGAPAWQQELGDKVVWLAGRHGQMAELVLNPPSLGAVEVRLNLSGQEATAQFFSANPNVRDAIEAALPRLREMMASAGIAMGEAMVSDQSFGQRDKAEQGPGFSHGGMSTLSSAEEGQSTLAIRVSGTSLLDFFA